MKRVSAISMDLLHTTANNIMDTTNLRINIIAPYEGRGLAIVFIINDNNSDNIFRYEPTDLNNALGYLSGLQKLYTAIK